MILATILITLPVMGLLVGFDFWHCRARNDGRGAVDSPPRVERTTW